MTVLSILLSDVLVEEPLSQRIQFQNWGFVLFLICFFIIIYSISKGSVFLSLMIKNLFRKDVISAEQINNKFAIKFLLCLQTIILSSVFLFVCFSRKLEAFPETNIQMFQYLAGASLFFFLFLLYKFLSYNLVGNIFFKKEDNRKWNSDFTSLICLSGFILFIPTLLMFYVDETYILCCYFYLIFSIFVNFFIVCKVYLLFFYRKSLSLYFILYLCAQEVIPLYFLYRGVYYLFIIAQRDTLLCLPT
jgi:hypothetical protein